MSSQTGSNNPEQTRRDIQRTRAELGETVAALAARADVKTRLRARTTAAAAELRRRVTQAGQSAKTTAAQRSGMLSQRASRYTQNVTQKAEHTATAVRGSAADGAHTAGEAGSSVAASTRDMTTKVGSSARAKLPVLAAAGAAAALAVVAYRRRQLR